MATDKEKDLAIAKEFVKESHVMGFVNALEGGIINLDEYLVDFLKYYNQKK